MSHSTQEKTRQLLQESLFPVAALFIGLFVLIVFIQIKAGVDTDQEVAVAIPRTLAGDGTVSSDAGSDDDVVLGGADAHEVNDPLLASAAALLKRKQWIEAKAIYDSLLAQGATSKLLSAIGLSYFRQGEYHKALDQLNSAINMRPLHASAYLYRAMTHARMGHNDKAVSDYQALIKLQPYHFEANYNLGLLLLKTNDYESAIATLSHSVTLVGGLKKAKALYALGSAYRKQGKDTYALAMKFFQEAIRIKPDYIEARFGLASLEPDTEEGAARAMAQYKVILELKPNYSPSYMEMGQRYAQRKDIPAALDAYRKAIQYDSSNSLVHYNFGLFLIAQKHWTEARQQFEEVIRNKPQDSQSHFNLGRVAYGEKSYDLALREYKIALDIEKGDYAEALLNMGLVYKQQHKYDDSIAMYQSAIKLRGAYPKAWFNTGLAYFKKNDYDKAELAFKTALSQDAEYEQAWHNLGLIYAKQVRMDEAIRAQERAIQIRPDYINALMSLADIYKDTKRYSESIALFNTVLKADDRFASAWHHLGEIYLNQGNLADAEQSLETALDMGDDGIDIRRDLANLYMRQRNYDKAIAQMESAVNMDVSNPALRLELAQAMKRAGRKEESYAALKKGLLLDPNNSELRKALQAFQR